MIVDSSALLAILQGEPEAREFANRLRTAGKSFVASATYLETCMVFSARRGPAFVSDVDALLVEGKVEVVPFSVDAGRAAVHAFLKYGKRRGHPAQLNFGDCISYAMSKTELMPLLFKGEDFRKTDVECAI